MSENSAEWKYDINDLVWAKMKGFPPWPGKVTEPTENMKKTGKKNSRCIFFFGSDNYAWIETGCLKPYQEFKHALSFSCKTQHFKDACKAIELYIENQGTNYNAGTSNGISESESERRFDNLVQGVRTNQQASRKKTSMGRTSTPDTSHKTHKRRSTVDQNTRVQKKKERRHSSNNIDILTQVGLVDNHLSPLRRNNTILDRPEVTLPESTPLANVSEISSVMKTKNIVPSKLSFGFIGLGKIGSGIVKNLLNSGHKVNIWNRTPDKMDKFVEVGAESQLTPSDVFAHSDITFCCVTDPQVAKEMVFGNCGILGEMVPGKAYVEMSGIDADTSQDIHDSIIKLNGRYLETMIQGSKQEAEEGSLVCLSAGDKSVFDDCESVFSAISKDSFYLGEVGKASKVSLILHTMKAISLAALAEGLALADRAGLPLKDLIDILSKTSLNSALLAEKGKAMAENHFVTNHALKLLQKDVNLTIQWSETMEQPCPVAATVNEVFKHSKRLGYSDHDSSAVYVRAKF